MTMRYHTRKKKLHAFLQHTEMPDIETTISLYSGLRTGAINIKQDDVPDPDTGYTTAMQKDISIGNEELIAKLTDFAGLALKFLGNGLFNLANSTFDGLCHRGEKLFYNYPALITSWKSRVWKCSRNIDGQKFDAYTVYVSPHAELIKRIQVMEAVHKTISDISGIYNAPISKGDNWETPECERVLTALKKVGIFIEGKADFSSVGKQYNATKKKQPLFLHGYTPKRIIDILTRCDKIVSYASKSHIEKLQNTYFKYVDKIDNFEIDTDDKEFNIDAENDASNKDYREVEDRRRENRIRSARLWWLAHFLKIGYVLMEEIINDIEILVKATESCVSKNADAEWS